MKASFSLISIASFENILVIFCFFFRVIYDQVSFEKVELPCFFESYFAYILLLQCFFKGRYTVCAKVDCTIFL